jgi:hypothetical protein
MDKFIIAAPHPSTGISNKIKCILSTLRFCEHFSQKPLLYWPNNLMCPIKFYDLFETKIVQLDEKGLDKIKKSRDFSQCSSYSDFIKNEHQYSILNTWRFMLFPTDVPPNFAKVLPDESGKNIDLEYERVPQALRKAYLKCLKKLVPSKSIKKDVSLFLRKHNLSNAIGIHVRGGDFIGYWDGRDKVSSEEKFFQKISAILAKKPNTQFFLATDSKEIQTNFIKQFGDKIIVYPNKDFRRNSKAGIKHALTDLIILSKTKHILGTYLSTFTEMAWWFGGCKAKVEIVGDEEEKKKVLDRHMEKFHSKSFSRSIIAFLKSLMKKSSFFTKVHEKLEYRQFKKKFSS